MRALPHRALVLALLGLGACATTWRPVRGADPAASLRASPKAAVRVTVTGWPEPVLIGSPQVVGDSLVGTRIAALGQQRGPRVAVPLTAVTRVEEDRADVEGTAAFVAVGVVGVVAFVLATIIARDPELSR
jgi:hypothetical protein